MNQYIGVKLINAKPMNRQEYNDFRGWQLPEDENGEDDGYLVEYIDGGKANTSEYAGYISWSPKEVFEKAYRKVTGLNFGLAIEALKEGKKVARLGWNGKGMWIALINVSDYLTYGCQVDEYPVDNCIGLKTANGSMQPGWNASTPDVLAEDWQIIE